MTARRVLVLAIVVLTYGVVWNLANSADETDEMSAVMQLGDVAFPHEMHYDTLELDCDSCHHETRAAALNVPHEQYFEELWANCVICHRPRDSASESTRCSGCHHASPTDIADETLSAKVVLHRSCWACHEVGRGAEASRSCAGCHSGDRRASEVESAEKKEQT